MWIIIILVWLAYFAPNDGFQVFRSVIMHGQKRSYSQRIFPWCNSRKVSPLSMSSVVSSLRISENVKKWAPKREHVIFRPEITIIDHTQQHTSVSQQHQKLREDAILMNNGKKSYVPRQLQPISSPSTSKEHLKCHGETPIINQRRHLDLQDATKASDTNLKTVNYLEGKKIYIPRNQTVDIQNGLRGREPSAATVTNVKVLTEPKWMISYKYPKVISDIKLKLLKNQQSTHLSTDSASSLTDIVPPAHNYSKKKIIEDKKPIRSTSFTRRRLLMSRVGDKGREVEQDLDIGNSQLLKVPWETLCELEDEGLNSSEIAEILQKEYGIETSASAIEMRLNDRSFSRRRKGYKYRGKLKGNRDKRLIEHETDDEVIKLPLVESISVHDLAELMKKSVGIVIKQLMLHQGLMVTVNQHIKRDIAIKTMEAFGIPWEDDVDDDSFDLLNSENKNNQTTKPPVVTIMGHVDHGKTSILDFIRNSRVASSEAGGITQAISAFHVPVDNDRNITFIDTPGHAAFTEMRKRGAKVTDIVVLVIAADDGIMEQTIESINAAHSADCPIVVAINKIDKATPQQVYKIKQDLLSHDVVIEDFGGDVQCAEISAKSGAGIENLLEKILIQADVMQLTANTAATLEGSIIESSVEKGLGIAASLIIRNGHISVGDFVVAGPSWGKVRLLLDDQNRRISRAEAGMPVKVIGLHGMPNAGDIVLKASGEEEAKKVALNRAQYSKKLINDGQSNRLVSRAFDAFVSDVMEERELASVPVIIKADVVGSMEAIQNSLLSLNYSDHRSIAKVDIVQKGVGDVTASDIANAAATKATIFAFGVTAAPAVLEEARSQNVDLSYHSVLYDLLDSAHSLLRRSLSPPLDGKILGSAIVRKVFKVGKSGKVAGCEVTEGTIFAAERARIVRDGKMVVYDGSISSLKVVKDMAVEVPSGSECGIGLKDFNDIQEGDIIQSYQL